jgi:hypothetical protein
MPYKSSHCEEQGDVAISEIASLSPEHHAVQGFVRNDILRVSTYLWRSL